MSIENIVLPAVPHSQAIPSNTDDARELKTVATDGTGLGEGTRTRATWYLTTSDPKCVRLFISVNKSNGKDMGWSGKVEDLVLIKSEQSYEVVSKPCDECYEFVRLLTLQFCCEHPTLTDYFVRGMSKRDRKAYELPEAHPDTRSAGIAGEPVELPVVAPKTAGSEVGPTDRAVGFNVSAQIHTSTTHTQPPAANHSLSVVGQEGRDDRSPGQIDPRSSEIDGERAAMKSDYRSSVGSRSHGMFATKSMSGRNDTLMDYWEEFEMPGCVDPVASDPAV